MAETNLQSDQNIEFHLVTMFEKLETMRSETITALKTKNPIQLEIRSLEFWRAVISECLASFVYVFVVCGAAVGSTGGGISGASSSVLLATPLAAGFTMTSLTQCFGHISGAHVNPSVSLAMLLVKKISPLRTFFFIFAQCGGGIAGAAFLYGVISTMYLGSTSTAIINSSSAAPWDTFGKEFILTFVVVFSYFISMDTYRKWVGTSSLTIGSTYAACSFVSMPHLNPARSLGPAFVLNKWESHWVYWLGPLLGGVLAGIIYEYIFNPKRHKRMKPAQDEESSSIHSDDVDNFDDMDKPATSKFHGSTYNNYRQSVSEGPDLNYCGSLYSAPKLERQESIYGGTKSLYCNSPSLTRPNLNRSQSVYAKSNTFINKDILPKNGPLVPTQSMYPIKINQQSHIQNQNVQNFLQQKNEGNYGGRAGASGPSRPETHTSTNELKRDNYAVERQVYDSYSTAERQRRDKDAPQNARSHLPNAEGTEAVSSSRSNRPESMYGRLNSQARHVASAAQSDDSNYSSYTTNSSTRNGYSASYHNSQKPYTGGYSGRCSENRTNQNTQVLAPVTTLGSYHHQHSPNPQY